MSRVVKTRESKTGEIIAYSENAIRNNSSAVEYIRTAMSALSGCTAGNFLNENFSSIKFTIFFCVFLGILGLTGIIGFLFYVFAVFGLWFLLLLKSGANWQKYFITRRSLLTNNFLGGLCTYVLFWTFLYGMVHVY